MIGTIRKKCMSYIILSSLEGRACKGVSRYLGRHANKKSNWFLPRKTEHFNKMQKSLQYLHWNCSESWITFLAKWSIKYEQNNISFIIWRIKKSTFIKIVIYRNTLAKPKIIQAVNTFWKGLKSAIKENFLNYRLTET